MLSTSEKLKALQCSVRHTDLKQEQTEDGVDVYLAVRGKATLNGCVTDIGKDKCF